MLDTLIAILAGLMIFPAAFSVGVNPDSGPSLIFITLPAVFDKAFAFMPGLGYVISILFYALLVLAALTSTISMHEIGTAFFREELHTSRPSAAWIVTLACCVISVLCSLSCGAVKSLTIMGKSLMDICDFITAQFMLPLGSFLTCIFVGWVVPNKLVRQEFTNWETVSGKLYGTWLLFVRFVCPACILMIFLHQFGVI